MDDAQVRVFDPPNIRPRGRQQEQPARVEVFTGVEETMTGEPGPAVNIDTGEEAPAGEPLPEVPAEPPRKRTSRKASP